MNIIKACFAIVLLTLTISGSSQERFTREQYINRYQSLAIEQMEIYGIPASIKMAQGLFESDNGNSRLAREANNHFGIKCKSTWQGETITHDDDAIGECFRKYPSAEESYVDHSEFLDKSPRYQALFKLDPMDYKGWAYGLKQAGYATNPNYPQHIIKIIEDNQLYLLDQGKDFEETPIMAIEPTEPPQRAEVKQPTQLKRNVVDVDNFSIVIKGSVGGRTVYLNNGSRFVVTRQGDTYASIASEFGLPSKKIISYNDLDDYNDPEEGVMVYVEPKNRRSQNGKLIHVAKEDETMHSISQLYGIRLSNLCGINRRPKDSQIKSGQQIRLM